MFEEISSFAFAVISKFWGLVAGVSIVALAEIYKQVAGWAWKKFPGWKLPRPSHKKIILIGIVAYWVVASFLAWQEKHEMLQTANAKLEVRAKYREIQDELARFHGEGIQLLVQAETNSAFTDNEFDKEFRKWDVAFQKYAIEKIGRSYYMRFSDPFGIPDKNFPLFKSPQRTALWRWVAVRNYRLQEFQKEFGEPMMLLNLGIQGSTH